MVNLVLLAAAVPFAIIVLAVAVLATVKYAVTESHVSVYMLGLAIRSIPLRDIVSVEYLPPIPGKSWSLLHQSGTVVMRLAGEKSIAISPSDAEGFASELKERVAGLSARGTPH